MNVTRQAVELGDGYGALKPPRFVKRLRQQRPTLNRIGSLSHLDLDELAGEITPVGGREPRQRLAPRLRPALLVHRAAGEVLHEAMNDEARRAVLPPHAGDERIGEEADGLGRTGPSGGFTLRAKWTERNEGPGKIDSSVAKAMGGGLARRATQTCIEVLGFSSLSVDYLLEKSFRDARIFDIYEGTGEIQRLIIARDLLGYTPKDLN
jgi:Acyl-CoA dehydrogenase, C-terminal domain